MQIIPFPIHYQSVYTNFDISSFSLISCTLEESALLNFIREKPNATQKEIATHIGKSERTVKTMTVKLSKQGIIERKNGRRNGYWDSENNEMNN